MALEELTTRYRALPVDHDAVTRAGGLRHYHRGILGTRNLPVHPVPAMGAARNPRKTSLRG